MKPYKEEGKQRAGGNTTISIKDTQAGNTVSVIGLRFVLPSKPGTLCGDVEPDLPPTAVSTPPSLGTLGRLPPWQLPTQPLDKLDKLDNGSGSRYEAPSQGKRERQGCREQPGP
jgi:hypothetical protein